MNSPRGGWAENMLPELSEIRMRRKQFSLTQSELARLAGVSQSLVTKIESGAIDPGYSKAKRLWDVFEGLHEKASVRARDLMSSPVISTRPEYTLKSAVAKIRKHGISQLPVIDGGNVLGALSEEAVLEKMHGKPPAAAARLLVRDAMGPALPSVDVETRYAAVSSLLEHADAVLVTKRGQVSGIISKNDALKVLLE